MLERIKKTSIKTKLIVGFVSIFLSTFLIAGWLSFDAASQAIKRDVTNHLESVGSIQKSRIQESLNQYFKISEALVDAVNLRFEMDAQNKKTMEQTRLSIEAFLSNYMSKIQDVTGVIVRGERGDTVIKIESRPLEKFELIQQKDVKTVGNIKLLGSSHDTSNQVFLHFEGPLNSENIPDGKIEIIFEGHALVKHTSDYTGLGETGEIVLVERSRQGNAHFLTPLRFDPNTDLIREVVQGMEDGAPILRALNRAEDPCPEDIKDYRGQEVICVNRYISEVDWGIVVKMDRAEAFAPIISLAKRYVLLGGAILLFTLLFAYGLVNSITRPLRQLSSTAQKIRKGDFSLRADQSYRGELGELASSFNSMTDRLCWTQDELKRRLEELKESQQKFNEIATHINEIFWIRDVPSDQVLYVSPAYETIMGRPREKLYKDSRDFLKNVHPEDRKLIQKEYFDKDSNGKASYRAKYRILRPDGSYRWLQDQAVPIVDREGKITRIVGTVTDITVIEDYQKSLRERSKQLEVSNSNLEEFAHVVAHDLKGPLRNIHMSSNLLTLKCKDIFNPEAKRYLKFIQDSSKRMSGLIDGILSYSKLNSENQDQKRFDSKKMVEDVVTSLNSLIRTKQARLHTGDLPCIYGHTIQIRRVFQNLIENALKYSSPNRRPEISIRAQTQQNEWIFSVHDNGMGFDKSKHRNPFTMGKRLHGQSDVAGHGIGLASVKKIIEKHGGRVWVESEVEKGSIFYFSIPFPDKNELEKNDRFEKKVQKG